MAKVQPKTPEQPAAPAPSAAPGTAAPQAVKVKKDRVKKKDLPFYPGLEVNAEGKPTKRLQAWPADFDPRAHRPLKRGHFESESVYLISKAERLEMQAKELRQEADDIAKGKPSKGKTGKLLKLLKRTAELEAELAGQGIDVKALLAAVQAKQQEEAAKAAAA